MQHGLAALTHRPPVPSAEVEEFARGLCGGDGDPTLFVQALKIAESKVELRVIRAQKVAVVERMRNPYAAPFASRGDPTNQEMRARILDSRKAEATIKARLPGLVAQCKDKIEGALAPCHGLLAAESYAGIMRWFARRSFPEEDAIWILLEAMADEPGPIDNDVLDRARNEIEAWQRDEHEALGAAAPDLARLDRYECRAASRLKRAVREFMKIKAAPSQHSGPGEEDRAA
jgi:hypothetical protein